MRETIALTEREQRRALALNRVLGGEVTVGGAAGLLGLSERRTKRLLAAYREEGVASLPHGNRGREPRNKLDGGTRAKAVELAGGRYAGLNHTHVTGKLAEEEGLGVSRSTVRRLLVGGGAGEPEEEAGAEAPEPPGSGYPRRGWRQEGMLLQIDASPRVPAKRVWAGGPGAEARPARGHRRPGTRSRVRARAGGAVPADRGRGGVYRTAAARGRGVRRAPGSLPRPARRLPPETAAPPTAVSPPEAPPIRARAGRLPARATAPATPPTPPPAPPAVPNTTAARSAEPAAPPRPAHDHPWRRGYKERRGDKTAGQQQCLLGGRRPGGDRDRLRTGARSEPRRGTAAARIAPGVPRFRYT